MKYLFYISFAFLILISCRNKKDLTVPQKPVFDFFPVKQGDFCVFEVQEKLYSTFTKIDSNYSLKVNYPETFKDAEGGISFKTYRSVKNTGSKVFTIGNVWSTKVKPGDKAIVSENNNTFLKISYPLEESKSWNGNVFNTIGFESYTVKNFGMPWEQYPFTVTIIHKNDTSLLSRDYRLEIYAVNLGLVYKETKIVKYSSNAQDFGKGIIVDGVVYKQKLLEHGKE